VTRIKICGLRTPEQALIAAEAGVDFVGMVFAESRRRVTAEEASEIVRALGTPLAGREMESPPAVFRNGGSGLRDWYEHGAAALERLLQRKRPLTVGVFANNDPDEINEIVDECGIDLIQLSGNEPWDRCLLMNRQVIKTLHLGPKDTLAEAVARTETGSAIAVHLDKADPRAFGGTGLSLDWNLAAAVAEVYPVWLAGGLTPENVAEAMRIVRPWCVDVSSGVELEGIKDEAKMRAFVKAVRAAE
jgi:phosphoribosylanthranilate isomerase